MSKTMQLDSFAADFEDEGGTLEPGKEVYRNEPLLTSNIRS